MAAWPSKLLPRIGAVVVLGLFMTATLTYAAQKRLQAAKTPPPAVTAPAQDTLVVPNVEGQAYVFAEGVLEDAGFAWRVAGSNGYAANRVVSQSPPAGTRVVDTGAPLVTVSLARATGYPQKGTPVNVSPYAATPLRLAGAGAVATPKATAAPRTKAAPRKKQHSASKPQTAAAQARTPDFVVAGAPAEPTNEMPLVRRAQLLDRWLFAHRQKSKANVQHWLYQNQWIVTGATFGWWHGAQALRVLIQVDRRAQKLWGVGAKSESVARAALAEVKARAS